MRVFHDRRIRELYKDLLRRHGRPGEGWSLWCKRPKTLREKEEIIIGSILTQRTSWKNVELAMARLRQEKICSIAGLLKNPRKVPQSIRSAGFYNQKSKCLLRLVRYITRSGGLVNLQKKALPDLRKNFLELSGIGPETADAILLYAFEKPIFVIDEYTRRLVTAKRITKERKYEKLQEFFERNIPRDWRLYQDFHALIVREGKLTGR